MIRSRFTVLPSIFLCIGFVLCWQLFAAPAPRKAAPLPGKTGALETRAERFFSEGSYARAIPLLRAALKTNAVRDREKARLHLAVALFKLNKQNQGIAEATSLLTHAKGQARVLAWLGRASVRRNHNGYTFKGKEHRGYRDDTPNGDVEYTDFTQRDQLRALDYLERAKLRARAERIAKVPSALSPYEEISLDFDLAGFLPRVSGGRFIRDLKRGAATASTPIDARVAYSRAWNLPRKVLYLLEDARRLDTSATKARAARALLAKGRFALNYRATMDVWAARWSGPYAPAKLRPAAGISEWNDNGTGEAGPDAATPNAATPNTTAPVAPGKLLAPRPYPYSKLDTITIWMQVARDYPRSGYADSALFLSAFALQQRDKPLQALAVFQRIMRDYPRSPRRPAARKEIAKLRERLVQLRVNGAQPPGTLAKIALRTRNIARLNFAAYRVRLETVWSDPSFLKNANKVFADPTPVKLKDATRRYGAPILRWSYAPHDRHDLRAVHRIIATPITKNGAYLVIASAPGVRSAQLVLVSDLALIAKTDKGRVLLFAANARSGKPVARAHVLLRQRVYAVDGKDEVRVSSARGTSDATGLFGAPLLLPKSNYRSKEQALAWVGNRYAFIGSARDYPLPNPPYYEAEANARIYCYTDRLIYRPGQTVALAANGATAR